MSRLQTALRVVWYTSRVITLRVLLLSLLCSIGWAADRADFRSCVQSLATLSPKVDKSLLTIEKTTIGLLKRLADVDRDNPPALTAAKASLAWLGSGLQAAKMKSASYHTVGILAGAKDAAGTQLTLAEQAKYKLSVKDGKLYDAEGKLFETSSAAVAAMSGKKRAIVIMDSEGNFYASLRHEAGKFNHEILARGQRVAFAGEFEVVQGVLQLISNESGHYLPGTSFALQAIESLRQKGAKFTNYHLELFDFRPAGEPPGTPLTIASPY